MLERGFFSELQAPALQLRLYRGVTITPPLPRNVLNQETEMSRFTRLCGRVFAAFLVVATCAAPSAGQGVTTAAMTGVVKDTQGAVVPGTTIVAVHQPSGTTYTGISQSDGRYSTAVMR